MKHYKSINKLFYDIVVKEDIDDRPFFIMQYEDRYLVFQDMQNIIKKFGTYTIAERYVRNKYYNPQIITIDFKKRLMVIFINLFHLHIPNDIHHRFLYLFCKLV